MNTIDDRLSNLYDIVEEESARPVILDLSDLHEEHPNVEIEDLQEAVEIAEAGIKPLVRRLSLTTLIIDLAVLVARKLAMKAT